MQQLSKEVNNAYRDTRRYWHVIRLQGRGYSHGLLSGEESDRRAECRVHPPPPPNSPDARRGTRTMPGRHDLGVDLYGTLRSGLVVGVHHWYAQFTFLKNCIFWFVTFQKPRITVRIILLVISVTKDMNVSK